MHLSFSPEEFERLLTLVALGETVMNDWTPPEEQTAEHRAAMDLLADLCEKAAESRSARLVTQDPLTGEWVPSEHLKEMVGSALSEYDNDVFWDELVYRLAQRDMLKEYGSETLQQMTPLYRAHAERTLLDYYWKEVRSHGIQRMAMEEPTLQPPRRSPRRRNATGVPEERMDIQE